MNIGEKIKMARKASGLKQSELAQKIKNDFPELKIGNTTISNYEVGTSKPDIETLNAIRIILELSPDYFFEQKEKPATDKGDGPMLSDKDKEVIERFGKLSYENQLKVLGYLDSLSDQDNQ